MKISSCKPDYDGPLDRTYYATRPVCAVLFLLLIGGSSLGVASLVQLSKTLTNARAESNGAAADDGLAGLSTTYPTSSSPMAHMSTGPPPDAPSPTLSPQLSTVPSLMPSSVTFFPGRLEVYENGLLLSKGLLSRIIASVGTPVCFSDGSASTDLFHPFPDFGATFIDPNNLGGWIYVSNSEVRNFTEYPQGGGVGAFTFDAHGAITNYQMILNGTTANCGGGRTPWGSWISCEEHEKGRLWQVDPTGERPPAVLTLGQDGGEFESFAYDMIASHYYVTEDALGGPLRRFSPTKQEAGVDPWDILLGPGETHFLMLRPDGVNRGTFEWTGDKASADENSRTYYQHSEGIDIWDRELRFVSKNWKSMYILHLDTGTYYNTSTTLGRLESAPDQVQRIGGQDEMIFFTEEGGSFPGIHALNKAGEMITILESAVFQDETTGLAFSPDGRHLYFAFQDAGSLFDITRQDGLPFHGKTMNVRYHAASA